MIGDGDWWSNWRNEDWQGKPKYYEKTFPSATLSNPNPTRPNPGRFSQNVSVSYITLQNRPLHNNDAAQRRFLDHWL
jgi:hypothetical protein